MIFQKSRIILGIVFGAVKLVFKLIYKFLKLLHLRLTFLIAVAGIILFFTQLWNYNYVRIIYWIVLGLSVVLAIVLVFKKLSGKK